jgi:CheY-like chemotaxis protein
MEKFVVIVFPNGLQGQIWSAILRSQKLSVIWESPDVPLPHILKDLHQQQELPDLLIIDTRLHHLQPLQLCRWCRRHRIDINILLVNGFQPTILKTERQWAVAQGAIDLLPRITQHSLVSGAAKNLQRTLDILEIASCNQEALIRSLLSMGLNMPFRYPHQEAKLNLDSPIHQCR